MPLPQKPVILGAGPCGLCLGWNFAQNGTPVLLLEKETAVGGLSKTVEDGGYRFDLGPHNLHPKYPDIKAFIQRLMGDHMRRYHPTFEIVFRGKRVRYPLSGIHVFKVLPLPTMLWAGLDFFMARLRIFFSDPRKDDTFEDWITNRFGRVLYGIYFGPYAEKAWKIKGSLLSDYVAKRRVPVLSITDYLRRAIKVDTKYKHTEDGNLDNFYLTQGAGQLSDVFATGIRQGGGRIETACQVRQIRCRDNQVTSVVYTRDGRTETVPTDFLFSTLPLPELVGLLDPPPPAPVLEAASTLDFCAERLVYVKIKRADFRIPTLLYFSDPKIHFNRVYKINAECVPPGRAAICVEFTCNRDDEIWNTPDSRLYDYTARVLGEHGVLRPEDIEGFAERRIEHAYPRFRAGFEKRMQTILQYLIAFPNLCTLGRQGLFSYANIDDVLRMAFQTFEHLNTLHTRGFIYESMLPIPLVLEPRSDSR